MSVSPKLTIGRDLFALILLLLLPMLLLVGLYQQFGQEQQEVRKRELEESVRLMRVRIDHELRRMYDLLRMLERSGSFQRRDLAGFYVRASSVLDIRGTVVVLRDRSGQQLVNTAVPWGTPLPMFKGRLDDSILATGKPVVSNLIPPANAPVVRSNMFVVTIPIFRDGEIVQFLSLGAHVNVIRDILLERRLSEGEIAVVGDSEGTILARSLRHDESVGKVLPGDFISTTRGEKGWWSGLNFEGVPIITSFEVSKPFDHSNASWIVSLGVTEEAFLAPLRYKQRVLGTLSLLTVLLAAGMLFLTARRLQRKFALASAELATHNRKQQVLISELHHRVKNMLARIHSIANLTARSYTTVDEFRKAFESRLTGMASTYNVLLASSTGEEAPWRLILLAELSAYVDAGAVVLTGPDVVLIQRLTTSAGMVVHELVTNAIKYGPLSKKGGTIDISWHVEDDWLKVKWHEHTLGPTPPTSKQGFGTRLIEVLVVSDLHGKLHTKALHTGWVIEFSFPLSQK
jgi:two-component sensor histidine kinase